MDKYDPAQVEARWQRAWDEAGLFVAPEGGQGDKSYILEMFPYPSGKIHMGHVRNYSIGDVLVRFLRMRGHRVLHPMGWDAFGLPAENAAIKNKIHPSTWTESNINAMRSQLQRLGFSYDWSRELATYDPDYYRWGQLLFLEMLERDLAYRKRAVLNYCPSCATVLANEQVEAGRCWRCSAVVEMREMEQWFLRITAYADELLQFSPDLLAGWPERVLKMQQDWIGRSEGARITFPLEGQDGGIEVFTTRQDTVYGATFLTLAPEHPLALTLAREGGRGEEMEAFIQRVYRQDRALRTADKTTKEGIWTGKRCINPVTGEAIPVWAANFVLMDYGTGAVMGVPCHDQRDFEFARAHDLPLRMVIQPPGEELHASTMAQAYEGAGTMVDSGPFSGTPSEEGKARVNASLKERGLGEGTINYRLRDWGISRQRYWGVPIPVIYCQACGVVPVDKADLPVILPRDVEITGAGGSPLARSASFVQATCPRCGEAARRETDTMDTFVDSSWYFLRFASPHYDQAPVDPDAVDRWLPVDQYIGGIEHAVLHLLYARFFTKVMRDLGYIRVSEPFKRLLTQGMVRKEAHFCPQCGRYLFDADMKDDRCARCGGPYEVRREKMSKSVGNVVDPKEMIERYGADTTRLYCLFTAPPEKDLDWSDQDVEGCWRFINRLWRLVQGQLDRPADAAPLDVASLSEGDRALRRATHKAIIKVTRDIAVELQLNTAIAALMELTNEVYVHLDKADVSAAVVREAVEALVQLLSPFAPHVCQELWLQMGHDDLLMGASWPVADEEAARDEAIEVVVQVNGKLRGRIQVAPGVGEEELRARALEEPNVVRHLEGKRIRKVVVVKGRLVNVVVG